MYSANKLSSLLIFCFMMSVSFTCASSADKTKFSNNALKLVAKIDLPINGSVDHIAYMEKEMKEHVCFMKLLITLDDNHTKLNFYI